MKRSDYTGAHVNKLTLTVKLPAIDLKTSGTKMTEVARIRRSTESDCEEKIWHDETVCRWRWDRMGNLNCWICAATWADAILDWPFQNCFRYPTSKSTNTYKNISCPTDLFLRQSTQKNCSLGFRYTFPPFILNHLNLGPTILKTS